MLTLSALGLASQGQPGGVPVGRSSEPCRGLMFLGATTSTLPLGMGLDIPSRGAVFCNF